MNKMCIPLYKFRNNVFRIRSQMNKICKKRKACVLNCAIQWIRAVWNWIRFVLGWIRLVWNSMRYVLRWIRFVLKWMGFVFSRKKICVPMNKSCIKLYKLRIKNEPTSQFAWIFVIPQPRLEPRSHGPICDACTRVHFQDTAAQARSLELRRQKRMPYRSPSSRQPNTAAVLLIRFGLFSLGI